MKSGEAAGKRAKTLLVLRNSRSRSSPSLGCGGVGGVFAWQEFRYAFVSFVEESLLRKVNSCFPWLRLFSVSTPLPSGDGKLLCSAAVD